MRKQFVSKDSPQDTLGDDFDIRRFHNVVLQVGAVPLTILEQVVEQYIARKLH